MQHKVYPKIYAPFGRTELENGKFSKYIDEKLPRPELIPYMNHSTYWIVSEKLDGTNTRLIWDGYKLQVKGRTEQSEVISAQKELLATLSDNGNFLFDETFGEKEVIIYGETFGKKIQNNPYHIEPTFRVFDINIGGVWLEYHNVEAISKSLGLEMVPHSVIKGWNAVVEAFTDVYFDKLEAGEYFEGLVAIPAHMPLTRKGERVITKLKVRDFEELSAGKLKAEFYGE